jgi:pSer/pThr/pTyr-binding forkhead associated (FHA) protein
MPMYLFAELTIAEPGRADRIIAVRATTTIGRDSENDIVLVSSTVSRQHALLLSDAAGVRLLDLESTNGTFVNDVPAPPDEAVRLNDGDVIRFGAVLAYYAALPSNGFAVPVERLDSRMNNRFVTLATESTEKGSNGSSSLGPL